MCVSNRPGSVQHGFSLIEILVTVLVLGIGLMGLAALQARMIGTEFEAYQRTQALLVAQDMASRLRSNQVDARKGSYSGTTKYGYGDAFDVDEDCDGSTRLSDDLCQWSKLLKGASVTKENRQLGGMLNAKGCIETLSSGAEALMRIRVTVAWQGMSASVAPSVACGTGDYGDDRLRRAMSLVVSVPDLDGSGSGEEPDADLGAGVGGEEL